TGGASTGGGGSGGSGCALAGQTASAIPATAPAKRRRDMGPRAMRLEDRVDDTTTVDGHRAWTRCQVTTRFIAGDSLAMTEDDGGPRAAATGVEAEVVVEGLVERRRADEPAEP